MSLPITYQQTIGNWIKAKRTRPIVHAGYVFGLAAMLSSCSLAGWHSCDNSEVLASLRQVLARWDGFALNATQATWLASTVKVVILEKNQDETRANLVCTARLNVPDDLVKRILPFMGPSITTSATSKRSLGTTTIHYVVRIDPIERSIKVVLKPANEEEANSIGLIQTALLSGLKFSHKPEPVIERSRGSYQARLQICCRSKSDLGRGSRRGFKIIVPWNARVSGNN